MFKNKNFMKWALPLLLLSVLYMFFYSGLQNDHINVITPYFLNKGWTAAQINNPITLAGYAVIIFYLICGTAMIKFGPVKFMTPCSVVLGLATAGVGLSEGMNNYMMYFVCLFLVRMLVVPLQMGGFMLCSNWFIKYRGRALGFVTIGSPLFSIVGLSTLTNITNTMGIRAAYMLMGGIVVVIGILTMLLVKDSPESVGLYADGSDKPTSDVSESEEITLKELLSDKVAWQLIVSYGLLQFIIVAMMAFMIVRYTFVFGENGLGPVYTWLAIGAALGIPMSYILGWVDDKVGSIKASLLLCFLYLFAVIPLTIIKPDSSVALICIWAFGVACMTGGMPTMHPAITSYVYGRKKYQGANKWIMTIQAVIMAFAIPYMVYFVGAATAAGAPDYTKMTPAYVGMLVMLVIAFVAIVSMWSIPDANLADREYGQK